MPKQNRIEHAAQPLENQRDTPLQVKHDAHLLGQPPPEANLYAIPRPVAHLTQAQGEDVWWPCPWCDFAVRIQPRHRTDCVPSRLRAQHLRDVHPDKDPNDPIAQKHRSSSADASRLEAVKESRINNLKAFAADNSTPHCLQYVSGFTLSCCTRGYKGTKSNLPPKCRKLARGGGFTTRLGSTHNPDVRHNFALLRGGQRLPMQAYGPRTMPGDGLCLFHSVGSYANVCAHQLRQRACDMMALSRGMLVWQDKDHREWALHDTGLGWNAYTRAIRTGEIWPGILETQVLSKMLSVILEVYVQDGNTYKRIARIKPEDARHPLPVWRLEYQNEIHFEPLVPIDAVPPPCATSSAPPKHVPVTAENHKSVQTSTHTMLLANVSSMKKHSQELYQIASGCGANTLLVTETRLAQDIALAHHDAKKAGFKLSCSNPRPMQARGQGLKEGGVAVLNTVAAPKIQPTKDAMEPLSPDDALHAIIPIHNSLEVHVIVAYAPQPAEDLRASLFRYAASLGDVPIIIAADWNVLPENSRAITQALSTGRWVDPAKALAACGDPRAETAAVAPTTHRDGTQGRRVDYFLVNKVALPIIDQAFILQDEPLVNHFAVGIRLRAPEALSFASLQPTTTYLKHTPTAEQREAVAGTGRQA